MNKTDLNSTTQSPTQKNSVDCFQCHYFFTTWEVSQPRGCKAFGFKTRKMPSQIVLETSGEPCLKFTPKRPSPQPKKHPKKGWIA